MKRKIQFLLSSALCLASGGAALAGDVAGGTGWSLSDGGVLTVRADYVWKTPVEESQSLSEWISYKDKIRSIVVEDGAVRVGDAAFAGCDSATSLSLPNSVSEIGECAFYRCESLESVTLPKTLTSLGAKAFFRCMRISKLDIPNGVTEISKMSFSQCYCLDSLVIPASVTKLDDMAFDYCFALSRVVCQSATPPKLGNNSISQFNGERLYVPAEAVEAYKASDWAEFFAEIIAIPNPSAASVVVVEDADGSAVRVTDGVVTVGGVAAHVYSLQGPMMPAGRPTGKGLYVVTTPRGAVRVAVR